MLLVLVCLIKSLKAAMEEFLRVHNDDAAAALVKELDNFLDKLEKGYMI